MFVATLIAAGKLTDEVVREGIDRLAATGHDVGAPHWLDEHDAADIVLPLADGSQRELRLRCVVHPEREQALLLQRLGLTLPQRLRPPAGAQM